MRFLKLLSLAFLLGVLSMPLVSAQDDAPDMELDQAIAAAGQDVSAKKVLEQESVALLKKRGEWSEMYRAVRNLAVVGTAESVPALAELLVEEGQSHLARIALENIPGAEATLALRNALDKVSSETAVGIIASLAVRKDQESVALFGALAEKEDEVLAQSALIALGNISGEEAVALLRKQLGNENKVRAVVAAEALLIALEDDDLAQGAAKGAYESLLKNSWPNYIRAGAFMRILALDAAQAPDHILDMIFSQDLYMRSVAIAAVMTLPGDDLAGRLLTQLPSLESDVQALLIDMLAKRKEGLEEGVLHELLASVDEAVRLAALKALPLHGTSDSIPVLTALLVSSESRTEKNAVVETLRRLNGDDVNDVLIASLPSAPLASRPELMAALAQRDAKEAIGVLLAHGLIPGCSAAAFQNLTQLATAKELPAILGLLAVMKGDEGRSEAENTVVTLCRKAQEDLSDIAILQARYGDWPDGDHADVTDKVREKVEGGTFSIAALNSEFGDPAPQVVKKLYIEYTVQGVVCEKTAQEGTTLKLSGETIPATISELLQANLAGSSDADAIVSFLRIYSRLGDATTFDIVTAYLDHSDAVVVDGAVRALAAWPHGQALDTLVSVAGAVEDPTHKNATFRGAIRLLRQGNLAPDAALAYYASLMDIAQGISQKNMLLAGLAETGLAEAVVLIKDLDQDPALKTEVAIALEKIKEQIGEEAFEAVLSTLEPAPLKVGSFVSIFDGETLAGWAGDPRYIRVEDGCIVLETKEGDELEHNTFLIWDVEELGDFEIMFKYRIDSEWANSGIQIRSEVFSDIPYRVRGYQADISNEDWITGLCYEEGLREFLARRGEKSIVTDDGIETTRFAEEKALGDYIRPHDWNDYHIKAQGDYFISRVNGHTMHEVTDRSSVAKRSGVIAFQIHRGPPMKVLLKDIRVKKLAPVSN